MPLIMKMTELYLLFQLVRTMTKNQSRIHILYMTTSFGPKIVIKATTIKKNSINKDFIHK